MRVIRQICIIQFLCIPSLFPSLPSPFLHSLTNADAQRLARVVPRPLLHDHVHHRRLPRLAPALYSESSSFNSSSAALSPNPTASLSSSNSNSTAGALYILARALVSASSSTAANPIGVPGVPNIPPSLEVVD
ncbi:hypothetical protein FB451DRAFT_1315760, partial [Mycena latifolia]